jgi:Uma2 family endonuclease
MAFPVVFQRSLFSTNGATDDEILELSRANPLFRFERSSDGEIIMSPPSGAESGVQTAELNRQLGNWNREKGGGTLFDSQTGFTLPDGALLSPDAAWLAPGRFEALDRGTRKKFAPLCPDLVFEVLSPSDSIPATRRKIETYMRNGASCVVLLNPFDCSVEVSSREGDPKRLVDPARLTIPRRLLPGARGDLTLDLGDIFGDSRTQDG